jgi:hypothetical protein
MRAYWHPCLRARDGEGEAVVQNALLTWKSTQAIGDLSDE